MSRISRPQLPPRGASSILPCGARTSLCAWSSLAPTSKFAFGKSCWIFRWAGSPPTQNWPRKPVRRRARARSARRLGKIRSVSWCRATASSARTATSPAIIGASPENGPCLAGKPEWSPPHSSGRQIQLRGYRGIGVESVDHWDAGFQIELGDAFRRVFVEHHHQRAQRIAVGRHKHAFAAQHAGKNFRDVVGQGARERILEAFATGWCHVIGSPPNVHLLLAPFFSRVVLVQPHEIPIVALIECFILEYGNRSLAQLRQHQIECPLRPLKRRRESDVELDPLRLQFAAGFERFRDSFFGQINVAPSGEQIFQIPLALAMAHEYEEPIGHFFPQKSFNPRTSIIE